MSVHLDLDALADLLAGVGDRSHLDDCPACRGRLEELAAALPSVEQLLAAHAQVPIPAEPDWLANSLQDQLANDAALAPPASLELARQRRRSRWYPALGAVAASAVLVAAGVLIFRQPADEQTTTTALPTYAVNESGINYSATSLAAAVPSLLPAATGKRSSAEGAGTLSTPGVGVPQQEDASVASGTGEAPPSSFAVDALAGLRTTKGLASCLASLADPDSDPALPLALDYAQYAGQPALVVVQASSRGDRVDVFVVGAKCDSTDANLLYFTRVEKP